MKPGHIKVFDGLRITTEHMNHMQGSFNSALQDIREIMGLGRVFRGFKVVMEDDRTITVNPGLAFDFHKNRIICEEPRTLTIEWGEEEEKYVCIKYEQVEDGLVEGEPTLIWDSCTVVICTEKPAQEENLIAIARLTRKEGEDGTFEITDLLPEDQVEESAESREVVQPQTMDEEEATAVKHAENEEVNAIYETAIPIKDNELVESSTEEISIDTDLRTIKDVADIKLNSLLDIKQGIERLSFDYDKGKGIEIGALILEPLRSKLSSSGKSSVVELLFTLADKEVALDSSTCSLSCQTLVNLDLNFPESQSAAGQSGTEETLRFQSTAQGEVSIIDGKVSQFGLSTIRFLAPRPEGTSWFHSDLTEDSIAHIPLGALLHIIDRRNFPSGYTVLGNCELLIKVGCTGDLKLNIAYILKWKGGINEVNIKEVGDLKMDLVSMVTIAWKAIGMVNEKSVCQS